MGVRVGAQPPLTAIGNALSGAGPTVDSESQPADDNPQVLISTRSWAGAVYVIAVNAGDSATDATISVPSLRERTLTVLGESRLIDSNGGSFIDHFDPLDLHIYVAL